MNNCSFGSSTVGAVDMFYEFHSVCYFAVFVSIVKYMERISRLRIIIFYVTCMFFVSLL